jgi:molybdopterin converting factor small subunit
VIAESKWFSELSAKTMEWGKEMRIRFAGPVAKLLGVTDYSLPLQQAVTVEEIVSVLATEFSNAEVFRENPTAEGIVPYVWMVLKNRTTLVQSQEILNDEDEIYFIPTVMGG